MPDVVWIIFSFRLVTANLNICEEVNDEERKSTQRLCKSKLRLISIKAESWNTTTHTARTLIDDVVVLLRRQNPWWQRTVCVYSKSMWSQSNTHHVRLRFSWNWVNKIQNQIRKKREETTHSIPCHSHAKRHSFVCCAMVKKKMIRGKSV